MVKDKKCFTIIKIQEHVDMLAPILFSALLTVAASQDPVRPCIEGGFTYQLGERYHDAEKSCSCTTFGFICARLGVGPLGKRDVATCVSGGFTYQLGESFSDKQQRCSCTKMGLLCMQGFPTPLGKREVKTCTSNGKTYQQGEIFNDGCNDCSCGRWGLTCTAMFCGGPLGR